MLPDMIRPTHNVLGRRNDPSLLPAVTIADTLRLRQRGHPNHHPEEPAFQLNPPQRRYDPSKRQLNTVTCGGDRENRYHPSGTRVFDIYETMLLQCAYSTHQLEGTLSEQRTRIGDAFPSSVAE